MAAITTVVQPTQRAYYADTYQHTIESEVVKIGTNDQGLYLVFQKTIFHPKGGGQPDDKGHLTIDGIEYPVIRLEESDESDREIRHIKHYITAQDGISVAVGKTIKQTIDLAERLRYAKSHTAGHLLANVVESIDPNLEGYNGHHFPGEERVVFRRKEEEKKTTTLAAQPKTKSGKKGAPTKDSSLNKADIETRINDLIKSKKSVVTNNSTNPRTVQIEGLKAYPCGGTHLRNIGEIGQVTIRKIEDKKGEIKIGYLVNNIDDSKMTATTSIN